MEHFRTYSQQHKQGLLPHEILFKFVEKIPEIAMSATSKLYIDHCFLIQDEHQHSNFARQDQSCLVLQIHGSFQSVSRSAYTGLREYTHLLKYVNCVISIPSAQTSQPSPAAPIVGEAQSSSTNLIS